MDTESMIAHLEKAVFKAGVETTIKTGSILCDCPECRAERAATERDARPDPVFICGFCGRQEKSRSLGLTNFDSPHGRFSICQQCVKIIQDKANAADKRDEDCAVSLRFICAHCGRSTPVIQKELLQMKHGRILEVCSTCASGPKCVKCECLLLPGVTEDKCRRCTLEDIKDSPSPEDVVGLADSVAQEKKRVLRGAVLQEAFDTINGERQDVYGNPEDSFALIADYWNTHLGERLTSKLSSYDVAMLMMFLKVARLSSKLHRDGFVDLCGYASLAADIAQMDNR